jgi:tRNA U34 2-thiouridine synthase MnmA/TrmU
MTVENKPKVVALFSGGLDSSIAILLMLRQGIEVHAITFLTHFGCDIVDRSSCSGDPYPIAEQFGFSVKLHHLGEEFIKIVQNPKWGHGKNMNPCVDCRVLMLSHAKYVMDQIGAVAIATGEVLGQRPMSQTRDKLNLVEKETGLRGRLLRPLSARLLKPTIPEQEGIIDRSRLENISGRSRKRQMELADEFGLEHYPTPAAGCLLTDVNYSRRLSDLLAHSQAIDFNMLNLLRVGRHFRFSPRTKIVIGRKEDENEKIEKYRCPEDVLFEARETGSPITLLQGEKTDEAIVFAARATARYCDDKGLDKVPVTVSFPERTEVLEVRPISDEEIELIRL